MHRRRVHPEECEEQDGRKLEAKKQSGSAGYKCGLCDFTAPVGYLMAAHVKSLHKGYKKCKRCNQVNISNTLPTFQRNSTAFYWANGLHF